MKSRGKSWTHQVQSFKKLVKRCNEDSLLNELNQVSSSTCERSNSSFSVTSIKFYNSQVSTLRTIETQYRAIRDPTWCEMKNASRWNVVPEAAMI